MGVSSLGENSNALAQFPAFSPVGHKIHSVIKPRLKLFATQDAVASPMEPGLTREHELSKSQA